jgi:hypothetical protein
MRFPPGRNKAFAKPSPALCPSLNPRIFSANHGLILTHPGVFVTLPALHLPIWGSTPAPTSFSSCKRRKRSKKKNAGVPLVLLYAAFGLAWAKKPQRLPGVLAGNLGRWAVIQIKIESPPDRLLRSNGLSVKTSR